jgi:hypothetical protein
MLASSSVVDSQNHLFRILYGFFSAFYAVDFGSATLVVEAFGFRQLKAPGNIYLGCCVQGQTSKRRLQQKTFDSGKENQYG